MCGAGSVDGPIRPMFSKSDLLTTAGEGAVKMHKSYLSEAIYKAQRGSVFHTPALSGYYSHLFLGDFAD